MERLTQIGRIFFGVAFVGLGIEHFIYQDFIVGRAPSWPESLPGRLLWAYLTGLAFIVASIAILSGKKARIAAVAAGILILGWALLRQIPVAATDSLLAGTWTMAGKALTFMGGCFAIAATFPAVDVAQTTPLTKFLNAERPFILLGRVCLGLFLVITGIQHFMFTEFVASLIPAWFPGNPVFWTFFAGVALICGGIGLFIPQTARLAALMSGLMVFSWFWIVHLPRTFFTASDGIAVFEALAVSGIAFVLAGYLSQNKSAATRKQSEGAPLPQATLTKHATLTKQETLTNQATLKKQPVEPEQTTQPGQTAQTGQTTQPDQTAQPAQPAQPDQTAQLGQKTRPGQTAQPHQTTRPGQTAQPHQTTQTGQTAQPGQTTQTA